MGKKSWGRVFLDCKGVTSEKNNLHIGCIQQKMYFTKVSFNPISSGKLSRADMLIDQSS